ncbi:hypothetical protein KJ786_00695 [Patescibacteria group bacterium]|nr:hypothetical protein [Patescibacteria group bacterium]
MKKIPTLLGIVIIIAWSIIAVGGAIAYQYFWVEKFLKIEGNFIANKVPTFGDYLSPEKFTGEIAPIDYFSNENAREFRGQIKKAIEKGVNFAGSYFLALWNCGKNCEKGLVMDATNGKVYNLPEIVPCGIDFRADSNLLIINSDKDCVKNLKSTSVKKRYFVWEKN